MKIISGASRLRFNSRLNHAGYAHLHNYGYVFDSTPRPLTSVYDHKLLAILDLPVDDDWWFWIDDDAFFTQFSRPLEGIGLDFDAGLLIFPKSPVNPRGGWTHLSSGNFFFRNCAEVHRFFQAALRHELGEVQRAWDESRWGMFTNGDQDKLVWELSRDASMASRTQLVPYEIFNTRPYHFRTAPTEHFLVHFAVVDQSKEEALQAFKEKFGFATDALIPGEHSTVARLFRHFEVDTRQQSAGRGPRHWWHALRGRRGFDG